MAADDLFGSAARDFFGRQQAVRRGRQRRALHRREVSGPDGADVEAEPGAETEATSEVTPGMQPAVRHERAVVDPGTTKISSEPQSAARSPWTLRVIEGDEDTDRLPLPLGVVTVGRQHASGILLHDESVSHAHAVIEADTDRVTIEDQNSTNGTKVNGDEIHERTDVRAGDTIFMGDVLVMLERAGGES